MLARALAVIALRLLSSKATTSGGRADSMRSKDYCVSARKAGLNMFDCCGRRSGIGVVHGDREVQGSYRREEGVEPTARETHAAGASAPPLPI
jgi:hypothetical protein